MEYKLGFEAGCWLMNEAVVGGWRLDNAVGTKFRHQLHPTLDSSEAADHLHLRIPINVKFIRLFQPEVIADGTVASRGQTRMLWQAKNTYRRSEACLEEKVRVQRIKRKNQ